MTAFVKCIFFKGVSINLTSISSGQWVNTFVLKCPKKERNGLTKLPPNQMATKKAAEGV